MEIAMASNHFWPVTGGIEQVIMDISKEMLKRGHEVSVHCSNLMPDGRVLKPYEEHEGIKIFRYPYKLRVGYYTSLFIPKIGEADILHLHGFGMLTNDYLVRKYHNKMPIVYTLHHGVYIPTKKILNKVYHKAYLHTVGLRSLQLADRIIASQELDIMRMKKLGISARKMVAVPLSIHDEILARNWELKNPPFQKYIIFLGRLHVEKSPEHVLFALKKLNRKDLGLVYAGPDDGELSKLKRLSRELGLADQVEFMGRVDEATKYGLLTNAEFLVLPSMYEGFGIVILEAWAMGKPVIASRVGGVPYVISDGVEGLLYDWGDIDTLAKKIEFLLENEEVRRSLGMAGRKKVEECYTRTKVVDRIEKIYKELLASKNSKNLT